MYNPFKKSYRIEEFKNQNGETKFAAKYYSFLSNIFDYDKFISTYGSLTSRFSRYIEHSSLEDAKSAIEKHKTDQIEKLKKEYKKSAIHYVE